MSELWLQFCKAICLWHVKQKRVWFVTKIEKKCQFTGLSKDNILIYVNRTSFCGCLIWRVTGGGGCGGGDKNLVAIWWWFCVLCLYNGPSNIFKIISRWWKVIMKCFVLWSTVQLWAEFCLKRDSNLGPCDPKSEPLTTRSSPSCSKHR